MSKNKFDSVTDLLRDLTNDRELIVNVDQQIKSSQLIKHLIANRVRNGFSQKDIAERMGCTQSRISKLESGQDDDLRLGDLKQYLEATDLQLRLVISPRSHKTVDEIKFHAFCIKQLLLRLVKLVKDDDEDVADGIARFACVETPINLLKMVLDAARHLPQDVLERLPALVVEDATRIKDEENGCKEKKDLAGV